MPKEVGENQLFVCFKWLLTSIWMITFSTSGFAIPGMVLTGMGDVMAQIVVIILAGLIPMYIQKTFISWISSPIHSAHAPDSPRETTPDLGVEPPGRLLFAE